MGGQVQAWGYGATAARLTPDQKVGSSNLSALTFHTSSRKCKSQLCGRSKCQRQPNSSGICHQSAAAMIYRPPASFGRSSGVLGMGAHAKGQPRISPVCFALSVLNIAWPAHTTSGTWCSGITPAQHAGGPGFNPQTVHFFRARHLGCI